MSLNKKDIEMITNIVSTILGSQKATDTVNTTISKEKKGKGKDKTTHKKSDIPNIITKMSKQQSIELFGNLTGNPKDTPYLCSLEKFFNTYNIQLDTRVRNGKEYQDKPFLSRQLRHQIIIKQLNGESKTTFNTVKQNCITFLQDKISKIPEDTTDIRLQKQRQYNLAELERWNNEEYKKA